MREIKFRAWDNQNKRMMEWLRTWKDDECDPDNDYDFKKMELYINQEGHILEQTYEHGMCDTHYQLQGQPKYTLMQYTGLKDKNGKEIYEGDIVKTSWETGQIIYEGDSFNLYLGTAHKLPDGSCRNFIEYKDNWRSWEVVGNIWENPELI